MQVNLNPQSTYSATSNVFNILATLFAGLFALLALIQLYFLFAQKKDLLAGFGFVHTASDPMDKALFFIAVALVCGAIALKRGLVVIAVVFGLLYVTGLYGNSFHIKTDQNFSLATLPPASYASFGAQGHQSNSKARADAPIPKIDESNVRNWMNKMREAGFTRCRILTQPERAWCDEINPDTKKAKRFNSLKSQGNCETFYIHVPKGQACP